MKKWKEIAIITAVVFNVMVNFGVIGYLLMENKSLEQSEQMPALSSFPYFQKNSCNDYSVEQLFHMGEERYIVYFYAQGCSACEQANEYLAAFLNYNFQRKIKIYFVDVTYRDDLLAEEELQLFDEDNFAVVYTPTVLLFENENVSYYTGSDSVFEVLDRFVKEG